MLDAQYWSTRYREGRTGWDLNAPSTPLIAFCESQVSKDDRILIPGAGRGYEAQALHQAGYTQVYVVDLSAEPLQDLAQRAPSFPADHLIESNFFDLTQRFDVVLEQTFFCAIDPILRTKYAAHMHRLLVPGGSLAGVWFNFPLDQGPPFGGSPEEYRGHLSPFFDLKVLEPCRNSMPRREGKELFIWAQVKKIPPGKGWDC